MFMTTVFKCHSLIFVIFNAKMTLFRCLVMGRVRSKNHLCIKNDITEQITLKDSCHNMHNLLHIHDMRHPLRPLQ